MSSAPSPTAALPRILSLMGPTAVGKTGLAIALGQCLDIELVSVDSALVYRGLDIGAAKPSPAEQRLVPHHLLDIRDPAEPYNAADFCRDAEHAIEAIIARGKTPLLVGGTMLYFKALLEGLSPIPAADTQVRQHIAEEARRHGWPYIHRLLQGVDPEAAANIHPHHSQRLSRALEVFRQTGKPLSDYQRTAAPGLSTRYQWVQYALIPSQRPPLHQRIEQRFEQMLAAGFLDEVQDLIARGDLHADLPAVRAVGYRQAWAHLHGEYGATAFKEKALAATRQLAKRQLTWLRQWPDAHVIKAQNAQGQFFGCEDLTRIVLNILDKSTI